MLQSPFKAAAPTSSLSPLCSHLRALCVKFLSQFQIKSEPFMQKTLDNLYTYWYYLSCYRNK